MNTKIKIMTSKPQLTDEEIQGYMNFESLIREANSIPKKSKLVKITKVISFLSGLAIVATVSYLVGYKNTDKQPREASKQNELSAKAQTIIPVVPDSNNTRTNEEKIKKTTETSTSEKMAEAGKKNPSTMPEKENQSEAPSTGYLQAEPVNGFPHLYNYFSSELKYPENAQDSIQGIVTISFIINSEGKPESLKIQNSLGVVFDQEIDRLIENMPTWKPATLNAKPVNSKISLPLTFKYERIKK